MDFRKMLLNESSLLKKNETLTGFCAIFSAFGFIFIHKFHPGDSLASYDVLGNHICREKNHMWMWLIIILGKERNE